MSDAWDHLRERLKPYGGEAAAQELLERLQLVENLPGWQCSLHVTGNRRRVTFYWLEPPLRKPLTDPKSTAQT
jgi:hypothetical protein